MAFAWIYVGDLLERLQSIKTRDPPYPPNQAAAKTRREIVSWFSFHRKHIQYEKNGEAILSILLPERRTDLVYGIRETSLEKIIARILCLPNTRRNDLGRWREPGAGDLADCVERAQKQAVRFLPTTKLLRVRD
jgi:DNA ligase-4